MSKPLFSYRKFWAECFGTAPELPMSRAEMDALGWDSCDIIIVTGDAYVDHPSFGMAVIGRLLEAQGFRVGIIAQPDWRSKDDFMKLGQQERLASDKLRLQAQESAQQRADQRAQMHQQAAMNAQRPDSRQPTKGLR